MTKTYFYIFVLCLGLSFSDASLKQGLQNLVYKAANISGVKDPFRIETKIQEGLEVLKHIAHNGNTRLNLPPLDPISMKGYSFDFKINETELKGFIHNITLKGHSDYEAKVNSFSLVPQPTVTITSWWPRVNASGIYNLSGVILQNNSVDGFGDFTAEARNLTIHTEVKAVLTQSWLQLTDLNVTYDVQDIWVNYTDESNLTDYKMLNESLLLGIANEVQARYLPSLLVSAKDLLNSYLLTVRYGDLQNYVLSFIQ